MRAVVGVPMATPGQPFEIVRAMGSPWVSGTLSCRVERRAVARFAPAGRVTVEAPRPKSSLPAVAVLVAAAVSVTVVGCPRNVERRTSTPATPPSVTSWVAAEKLTVCASAPGANAAAANARRPAGRAHNARRHTPRGVMAAASRP